MPAPEGLVAFRSRQPIVVRLGMQSHGAGSAPGLPYVIDVSNDRPASRATPITGKTRNTMRKPTLHSALLLAAITMTLTSCSRNPVAPDASVTDRPGTTGTANFDEQDPAPETGGGLPGTVTVPLLAGEEGLLTVGRFTLWIHMNSLKMPATIKLSVANPEAMECAIEVSPPQANDFQVGVHLIANLSNVPAVDYSTETMFYWNGGWQQGTDVSAHSNQQNVVAHFHQLSNACQVGPGTGGKGRNRVQGTAQQGE